MKRQLALTAMLATTLSGCLLQDGHGQGSGESRASGDDLRLSADGTMFLLPGEPDPTLEPAASASAPPAFEATQPACDESDGVLVFGGPVLGKDSLVLTLGTMGYNVTEAGVLPEDLSGFQSIYFVGHTEPLTEAERARLFTFVADGGGLLLNGERPCCDTMNDSLTLLVNDLVAGGGITIGNQGDIRASNGQIFFPYEANPDAQGGINGIPNTVRELRLISPGGISGISASENILATGFEDVPVAGVWGKQDLTVRAGRLTVIMDSNWLHVLESADNLALLENINEFMCGATPRDEDNDGVVAKLDCNDYDATVGSLLYENVSGTDDGFLAPTSKLDDPWGWDGTATFAQYGGQQAQLGQARDWSDVVVFATVSASGTQSNCGNDPGQEPCSSTDRWRAGLLLRAQADADQDEGFHGYRCALSSNAVNGCYEDGLFLQLAEFMDAPEDDIDSECSTGGNCLANTTFDQLGRQNHELIDLSKGDVGYLKFYAVGNAMYCEAEDASGQVVTVTGVDDSFTTGSVGLSTLNAYGEFDQIRVCQALGLPDGTVIR